MEYRDQEGLVFQLLVLNRDWEQVGCQYLLDSGSYGVLDEQGGLLSTVEIRARRITFRTADGSLLANLRLGYPDFGGTQVEILDLDDETVGSTYLDGYWLALDEDLRLRLFDFVHGREVFTSQPLELSVLRGVALSDDRGFVALIVSKVDTPNSFLQIWGYPAH